MDRALQKIQNYPKKTNELHYPWKKDTKHGIRDLSTIVRRVTRKYDMLLTHHYWVHRWCYQIINCLTSRRLKWRGFHEVWYDHAPNNSRFRFYAYEPIFCTDFSVKQLEDMLKPMRFLGIYKTTSDEFIYFIITDGKYP